MKNNEMVGRFKCYGSTMVGPRGQMVIPVNARKELGIESGDTLLAFTASSGHPGLILIKADTLEEMMNMMSDRLAKLGEIIKRERPEVSLNENGA